MEERESKAKVPGKRVRVVATDKFPDGYAIIVEGGSMLPASSFEVLMWKMYCEVRDENRNLRRRIKTLESRVESRYTETHSVEEIG